MQPAKNVHQKTLLMISMKCIFKAFKENSNPDELYQINVKNI